MSVSVENIGFSYNSTFGMYFAILKSLEQEIHNHNFLEITPFIWTLAGWVDK